MSRWIIGRGVALGAVVALIVLGVLLSVAPVQAQPDQRVEEPAASATIDDTFVVAAIVRPDGDRAIARVEARLSGPSSLLVELDPIDRSADGGQRWAATVDPLVPDRTLANGSYRVEIRSVSDDGAEQEWVGHDIAVAVPPARPTLSAAPLSSSARQVRLTWDPVRLPDFLGYRIERRPHAAGGAWTTAHQVTQAGTGAVVDTVPAEGEYRYRLAVLRRSGADQAAGDESAVDEGATQELQATSPTIGVRATTADPGVFTPPAEGPAPPAAGDPDPGSGDPPAPVAGAGPIIRADTPDPVEAPAPQPVAPGQPAGQAAAVGQPTPVPEPAQAVVPEPEPQDPPTEAPATPQAPDLGETVFEYRLPFAETASELTLTESETAFIDGSLTPGGTLAVYTEQTHDQTHDVLTATAGGLVIVLLSAHVLRFATAARRRGG